MVRTTTWVLVSGALSAAGGCEEDASPVGLAAGGSGAGGGGGGPASGILSRSPFSASETDPRLVAAPDGKTLLIAWTGRRDDGPSHVGYVWSKDGGASWSSPERIQTEDRVYLAPDAVAGNTGVFRVAFLAHARNGRGASILVATADGATAFGAPVPVTDETAVGFYGRPRIDLTNSGRMLVAYTELAGGAHRLVVATSVGGVRWERNVLDGTQGVEHPFPCAATSTPRGRSYLAVRRGEQVLLGRSLDSGTSWDFIGASADGEEAGGPPSCVAAGEHVWVSYGLESSNGLGALRVAHSGDKGESIDARSTVHDPSLGPSFAVHQLAREPRTDTHLVYYEGAGPGDEAASVRRVRLPLAELLGAGGAGGFGGAGGGGAPPAGLPSVAVHEPVTLQLRTDSARFIGESVGVAFAAGALHVAYVDNDDGAAHVAYAVAK
jgi:hypothetical protein